MIYIETKTTLYKKIKTKNLISYVKDFVFLSISVKCIFWQIQNKIVKNYVETKTTFEILKPKIQIFH